MVEEFVKEALREDIGRGDLYALVAKEIPSRAKIVAKDSGVFAGTPYVKAICALQNIELNLEIEDGDRVERGCVLARLFGSNLKLLESERTILNTLQHASGIATNTARFVERLKGSGIKLLDTRKTRPLLRALEKYAVRVGGGHNHRMGLDDCLMIKDTHLRTIGDLNEFVKKAREAMPLSAKIEIECENIETAKIALECGADIVMCDNMEREDIVKVCELRSSLSPHTLVEVSGNITLENLSSYKGLPIDLISSGSLIHQAVWLDFSMKMEG